MKDLSIRAKLEAAAASQQFAKPEVTPVQKERQNFFTNAKTKRGELFRKAAQQAQKYEQRRQLQFESMLNAAKWKKSYSGPDAMAFGNKDYINVTLQLRTKEATFAIFDATATGWPLFENQKPIVGPLSLDELHDQLENFKGE